MKIAARVDAVLVFVFIASFFTPLFISNAPSTFFGGFFAATKMSACVSWKSSVEFSYAAIILFDLLVPFYWVSRLKIDHVRLGVGHFFSAFFLSGFGLLILFYGIPFENLDGGAVLLSKLYCNSIIGSFLILSCICFSVALFFSYLLIVVKFFLLIKWR